MRNIFKKLFIPSGQKTEVVAYKSWVVRWHKAEATEYSWGSFSFTATPESEIFPSKEDAVKFAEQLREAFKLVRYSGSGVKVTVEENQNKLATFLA